jgi:spermidine/putrescine transport system permease protein
MKRITSLWSQERSFLLFLPAVLWQTIFMVAPVLVIVYFSVIGSDFTLTLDHYRSLIHWPYFAIIFRSLLLAGSTAILSLFIAYPVAYFLAIKVQRFKNVFLFFLTLPFWINFLVQIYAWYFLLERNGLINAILLKVGFISEPILLSNKLFAIFIVMVYCYLPFMIMPLYSIIEKLDTRLFDASADLGATPWQTFRHVTLPLTMPGIKTGLLLVLIPTFGEFVIPSLLGGSKYMLVGSLISFFFLGARDKSGGSAFTCLSGTMLIGVLLLLYFLWQGWHIRKVVRGQ